MRLAEDMTTDSLQV